MAEKYLIGLDSSEATYELDRRDTGLYVRREGDDRWQLAELERIGESDLYVLLVDSRPTEIYIERRRGGAVVTIGRHAFDLRVQPWRPGSTLKRAGGSGPSGLMKVLAPMTGSVVEVRCEVGQQVDVGDVLLVVESMKMNNELRATAAGRVESVPVVAGQRVKAGDLLVAVQSAPA